MGDAFIIWDQRRLWLHWQDGIESQRMWPIHWGPIKFCDFEFVSSLCTYTPKPFLVLIGVWLNLYEERFTTNLLPQTLSGFLVGVINFIQVVGSPSCIFHIVVPDEIGNNSLEYMGVQILDSLHATMRQQPENVDHLRCSRSKTSR